MASYFSSVQQHPASGQNQGGIQQPTPPPPPGLHRSYNMSHQQPPPPPQQQQQQQHHPTLHNMNNIASNGAGGGSGGGLSNGYGHHDLVAHNHNPPTSQPPGTTVMNSATPDLSQFQEHLEAFRRSDKQREDLIVELASEHANMVQKYREAKFDLAAEQDSRRLLQQRNKELDQLLESQTREHARLMTSNPFVFVIIDGDGAIFSPDLIQDGAEGGARAASMLSMGILNHLRGIYQASNVSDWSIVVQVILNMDGLGKKLLSCGLIGNLNDLAAFGIGFNRSHLFSFIDVGQGKERADHKVRENFRLFAPMGNCKHVYFGPCHDNGYIPFLDPYYRDSIMRSKLTLIESTPAEREFQTFEGRIKFEEVFRSDPLPPKPAGTMNAALSAAANAANRRSFEMSSTSGPPAAAPIAPKKVSESPRQPAPAAPAPSSWAAMSKSGTSAGKTIDIAPAKKPARKYILLNTDYERLDEGLQQPQQQYIKRFNDRIREKNCCNNYHLKGYCTNGDSCNFQHGERLSEGEQRVLRHKARSIKCNSGSYCEDFDCPYGHRCKFGGKECGHDDCRFFDTHHVDSRAAYKKYEDGTYEACG